MSQSIARFALAGALLLFASPGDARNTFHDLDVAKARAEGAGHENVSDLPIYMHGQNHPAVAEDLGVFTANRSTNAANKSDEAACQIAFLSAVISLQDRARSLGAHAVIDVRSVTRNQKLESPTQYRCVAGTFVAGVALEGRMVNFKK